MKPVRVLQFIACGARPTARLRRVLEVLGGVGSGVGIVAQPRPPPLPWAWGKAKVFIDIYQLVSRRPAAGLIEVTGQRLSIQVNIVHCIDTTTLQGRVADSVAPTPSRHRHYPPGDQMCEGLTVHNFDH